MKNNIDHPDYYNDGKIEVIDFIEDKDLNFNLGNVIKYVARHGKKSDNAIEDLEKAKWYIEREIARLKCTSDYSVGVADVTSVDLLSAEEADEISPTVRRYDRWWWLSSFGKIDNSVARVYSHGVIDYRGSKCDNAYGATRPFLTISNLDAFNIKCGTEIEINGTRWIVIADNKVLYNDEVIQHRFDYKSNQYELSKIKRFLYRKFGEYIGKQSIKVLNGK